MTRVVLTRSRKLIAAAAIIIGLAAGGLLWWGVNHRHPKLAHTRERYGGFVPAHPKRAGTLKQPDALQPALDAYDAGRYRDAEAAALRVVEGARDSKDPKKRTEAARARYVLAFSAARRKELALARERFALLRAEASKLPGKGKQEERPGIPTPTLEEEGAFQHAVCTAALGDKKAAEAEYMQFMRDHPESPLMSGVMQRLERLHSGHLPPEAEAAWERAMRVAEARRKARQREQSLCGPECLAELLRRQGEKADVHALAREMKTDENGTSLKALADAARKHGFAAKGLALTQKGLLRQPVPLIALIEPGHYVIVDKASPDGVTIWEANANGLDKPGVCRLSVKDWKQVWRGISLVLTPKTSATPPH